MARVMMVKEWLGGAWSLSGEQVRGDDDGNKGFGLESWNVEDGNVAICASLSLVSWIRGVSFFQSSLLHFCLENFFFFIFSLLKNKSLGKGKNFKKKLWWNVQPWQ